MANPAHYPMHDKLRLVSADCREEYERAESVYYHHRELDAPTRARIVRAATARVDEEFRIVGGWATPREMVVAALRARQQGWMALLVAGKDEATSREDRLEFLAESRQQWAVAVCRVLRGGAAHDAPRTAR